MIIYNNTKDGFINDVKTGVYVDKISESLIKKMNRHTGMSETRSWMNSLSRMRSVLDDCDIPSDAGIAIEYNIPTTSKRVDFIISGYDEDKKMEAVFIELKQWESAEKIEGVNCVSTYLGGRKRATTHPSYQVWSYTQLLKNNNLNIQKKNIKLQPCAFLHNYRVVSDDAILDNKFDYFIERAPVFTMTDEIKLTDYIKEHIKYGDKLVTVKNIDESVLRPSKSLQDCLLSMMMKNREFILIDEQQVIYETIMHDVRLSNEDDRKRVVIVKGGPGTGKSVIGINLLVQSIKENIYSSYVTKNSAPREVFYKKLIGTNFKSGYIKGLFLGSGSFTTTPNNTYGFLICDEAHRLNEKSGMFKNKGENQTKEIIHSARASVFFIDEKQTVTASDAGSVSEIKKWAKKEGALIKEVELLSQFRCGGSDGYLSWIDNTLQISETANFNLKDIPYDFKVFDDPNEMRAAVDEKNKIDNRSRLVAGYCWEWISKKDESAFDINIDDFHMQWNLNSTTPFAIDKNSIEQVGCIHTTQGLEFNYVGVIIGDDLREKDGQVITDFTKRAKSDKSLNGIKTDARKGNEEALKKCDEIIRNTYRTLMTRGMKGCYIYCTDKNLSEYFKRSI
ncbi:MAG: DNA/RNA helicase domain-containing protein [Sphaerochaeta sp.]